MTKRELLAQLKAALTEKGMFKIDGGNGSIGVNDNKAAIQNAIDCLMATDEEMADYLTVVKLRYPNIYRTITNNPTPWLIHSFNRLAVYNMAKSIIGG